MRSRAGRKPAEGVTAALLITKYLAGLSLAALHKRRHSDDLALGPALLGREDGYCPALHAAKVVVVQLGLAHPRQAAAVYGCDCGGRGRVGRAGAGAGLR